MKQLCLEVNESEIKINQLEKKRFIINSFRGHHQKFMKNNRLLFKYQQKFKSKKHNVFHKEVNEIVQSANEEEKYNQQIQQKCAHMYGAKIQFVRKKKIYVIIKNTKMIDFDDITKENLEKFNPN